MGWKIFLVAGRQLAFVSHLPSPCVAIDPLAKRYCSRAVQSATGGVRSSTRVFIIALARLSLSTKPNPTRWKQVKAKRGRLLPANGAMMVAL